MICEKALLLPDKSQIGWKDGLPTSNGGWIPHTSWTINHSIIDDDLATINFDNFSENDLKFSVVTNGYRCMDHLFQNIYDHVVKLLRSSDLFKTSFINKTFDVSS